MEKARGRVWAAGAVSFLKRRDEGWTFIETIIVIAIIIILTGTVGFVGMKYIDGARKAAALGQIDTFRLALNAYYMDTSSYPSEGQGLGALWEKPVLEPVPRKWAGPYLDKKVPKDSWGNDYVYSSPGPSGLPFGVKSLGADGREGGDGNAADILSWESE